MLPFYRPHHFRHHFVSLTIPSLVPDGTIASGALNSPFVARVLFPF